MKHADTLLRGQRLTAFTITIALILASILTASGLLVLAQSRDSGDGMPVIGTIPDGQQGSTVTIRPALDDETLIGQTTSFWTLTPDVARDALTQAGLPASADPVSQLTSMVKSTGDASLAMRIMSGVYARVTDGSHDPVGVFKGEGSARIMDGVYFAAGSQGTMTVFHTPDTLYMTGLVDTGHVTEQDAVDAQQQLVTPDTTDSADNMTAGDTSVQATPSDTTADAVFAPAVLRTAPTGTARNTGYDNNQLYNGNRPKFKLYYDIQNPGDPNNSNWNDSYFLYGATENGMRVVCIDPNRNTPSNGSEYWARTLSPTSKLKTGEGVTNDLSKTHQQNSGVVDANTLPMYQRLQNLMYWGYGGPGYTMGAAPANQNGSRWYGCGNFTADQNNLFCKVQNVLGYTDTQVKDPTVNKRVQQAAQYYTHRYLTTLLHQQGINSFGWYADKDFKAKVGNSVQTMMVYLGRLSGDNAGGLATHMELVELEPVDPNAQVRVDQSQPKIAQAQWMLGWRYHNYNLTVRTQLYSSDPGNNNPKETTECSVKTVESDGRKTLVNQSNATPDTHPCDSLTNTVHDAITVTNNGPSDKPNDHWTITWWLNVVEEDGTKHTVSGTLPVNDIIGVGQSNSKTYNTPSMTPGSFSSSMKPSANAKWTTWPKNAQIWYDVDLNANGTVYGTATSDGGVQTTNAAHHAATQQPGIDGTTDVTINDGKEAFVTPGTGLKLTTEFRSDYGRKDKNGNKAWDVLKAPQLGKSQPVLDHLRINPTDSYLTGVRLDMKFTLKYSPTGYGQNVRASKTLDKAEPINGVWLQGADHETDSPQFTPKDLGMTVWQEGYYWFDVVVKRASVAAAPGLKADSYEHAGAQDPKEHFRLTTKNFDFQPSITSHVADPANVNSKDTLTVKLTGTTPTPGMRFAGTFTAHGTLYWTDSKGKDGTNIPANAKTVAGNLTARIPITANNCKEDKQGIVTCTGSADCTPTRDTTGYGSGYYTYVWRLEKTDCANMTLDSVFTVAGQTLTIPHKGSDLLDLTDKTFPKGVLSDGWRPAREQTQQDAQWTLNITKTTCIGNTSSACTWNGRQPIQGAKLTLTETDANWKPKKNGQTITLTTGKDGKASTGTQHIGSGETRHYTLTETSVPKPYAKPRNGAWHVTVTQTPGTRGARITMQATGDALQHGTSHAASGTPAANTATGIQNQAEAWTVEIGNLRPMSATPPQTGWTHDAGHLLAIGIITTIVTGMGIAFALHRRHTHATNMGRHEA